MRPSPLYYEVAGSGETLLLVHAGIADSRMWDPQFAFFAQKYQVVRCDLRGFGQTQVTAEPFYVYQDLYELMGCLGILRAHLVGCSKGGTALMDLALAYPDRAASLVMVASSPSGYCYDGPPPCKADAVESAILSGDLELANELEAEIWVDGPYRLPIEVTPHIRDLMQSMNRIALKNDARRRKFERPVEVPAVARLDRLQCPTLLIVGDLDQPAILAAADFMAANIPGAQKAELHGAAHMPSLEKPAEFNAVLEKFLMRVPRTEANSVF